MKELEILRFGFPALRIPSRKIDNIDQRTIDLLDRLKYTLYAQDGRAAIAAPQVGKNVRLTIIDYGNGYEELINPRIVERYGENIDYEGCLSLPGYSGRVARADRVVIEYIDRDGNGNIFDTKTQKKLARCYQHEFDHFDGILYTDRLVDEWIVDDYTDQKVPLASFANSFGAPPLEIAN